MKSLSISNFLVEISSLSHSVVFLYFFALITEEGFFISPGYSLELFIQMLISFLVIVERSDRMWPTGEGNGKPLQYSCLENPMNSMKRQKDRELKDELPRSVDAQYATGHQWRGNSRKNEGMESKQKQHPVVDVTGDRSKVRCSKEQYCIGIWNVRSTNQGKLEVVKQEMTRVNVDILGISELKWTGMGEFNSDDHYIYSCGQESLRRNGVAFIVSKRVRNAVLECNLKNNRMIPVRFQGKPFNITVIQVYALTYFHLQWK